MELRYKICKWMTDRTMRFSNYYDKHLEGREVVS